MTTPTESYLKVAYNLRPAKQVERRMMIDAFQIMSRAGFQIGDYQYTGFGSIYFVDFILFHKLLGIRKMLDVEYSTDIEKRVLFNKPFDSVDLEMKPISEVIPHLSPDIKHLLWLDYDNILHREVLADAASSATQLSCGSILIITVDVEPPTENGEPKEWMSYFEEEAYRYFKADWDVRKFGRANLPRINIEILHNAIKNGLAGRTGVQFFPVFSFLYRDGHQMLTLGGVVGTEIEGRFIDGCDFSRAPYIRRKLDDEPYRIKVPQLTTKERFYLDSAMPCADEWKPSEFELDDEAIKAYREIYRFMPTYAELLLG